MGLRDILLELNLYIVNFEFLMLCFTWLVYFPDFIFPSNFNIWPGKSLHQNNLTRGIFYQFKCCHLALHFLLDNKRSG